MEGWLWKKGAARALSVGGTSKRRWFKLQVLVTPTSAGSTEKRLALTYFKSPDHARAGAKKLLGHVDLSTATEVDVAGTCMVGGQMKCVPPSPLRHDHQTRPRWQVTN